MKLEHTKLEMSDLRLFMEEAINAKSKIRNQIGIFRNFDQHGSSLRLFYQHKSCNSRAHYDEYVNWQRLNYQSHYEQIIKVIRKKVGPKVKRFEFECN